MFRQFTFPTGTQTRAALADTLFRLHPTQLAVMLELAWNSRIWDPAAQLGVPDHRSDIPGLPPGILDLLPIPDEIRNPCGGPIPINVIRRSGCVRWHHMIYAYMIENTRCFEIFRRVIHEYRHGELLGVPLAQAQHWLRNTEELFFRDPTSFFVYSVSSHLRSDLGASRRHAYYRMFGMDLNHGMDDGKPYSFIKADAANREFVATLEEFAREVWVGISNANNTSGDNPRDDAAIADLAKRLHDMLVTRRQNGNLSQEEFLFVSTMEWFHLTLEFNSPIVVSLRAEGSTEEERLKKIAERVKLPAHGKSYYFFLLAEPMSRLLTQIETGIYNDPSAVAALYTPGSPVERDMRSIITYWSQATGRNMKLRQQPVSV